MDLDRMDREKARKLLCPVEMPSFSKTEEQIRPWFRPDLSGAPLRFCFPDPMYEQLWDSPLYRVYDTLSGSFPDETASNRMRARDYRRRLDDRDSRKATLTTHVNHHIWEDTPYISLTSSQAAVWKLAEERRLRGTRGDQYVVVINPRRRFALGLPILDCGREMKHYGIENPYRDDSNYYQDHYLCLWEVTPDEIVGIWSWNDLRGNVNWYRDVVEPSFLKHWKEVDSDERWKIF